MKCSITSAFTLIEMLTVMAVIAILASLIVAVYGFAQKKAALSRAQGEISAMGAACENYKGDFAGYPREIAETGKESDTDDLDPREHGDPTDKKYKKASIYLYKCLSGDAKPGTDATRRANPDDEPTSSGQFVANVTDCSASTIRIASPKAQASLRRLPRSP